MVAYLGETAPRNQLSTVIVPLLCDNVSFLAPVETAGSRHEQQGLASRKELRRAVAHFALLKMSQRARRCSRLRGLLKRSQGGNYKQLFPDCSNCLREDW